jgi:hypothetical protein
MDWALTYLTQESESSDDVPAGKQSRVWSLWDIMNIFDVHSLTHIMHKITQVQLGLVVGKMTGEGGKPVPPNFAERLQQVFDEAELLFKAVDLQDCLRAVQSARDSWKRPLIDISAANEIAYRLSLDIIKALGDRLFLRVSDDRRNLPLYMRGGKPHAGVLDIFGDTVKNQFNSATSDIIEAGNCLAAECNTAAVFHLMRAAEIALRAIAVDREVEFANKPIHQQEWGTILGALEGILRSMRLEDGRKWQRPEFKEAQVHFYNDAVQELRAFNEAWRRFIAHADKDAFYDRDYAWSVFNHVKLFMQKLSTRVSENKIMPKYWDTE